MTYLRTEYQSQMTENEPRMKPKAYDARYGPTISNDIGPINRP